MFSRFAVGAYVINSQKETRAREDLSPSKGEKKRRAVVPI